jgi:quercetin dioxygenase-like cupin family protein
MNELIRNETLSLTENNVPPGLQGPLPDDAVDHAHYVIDGELMLQLGNERVRLATGGFAFAPSGVQHAIANESHAAARYVSITTPSSGTAEATVTEGMPGRVKVLLRGPDSGGRLAVMDNVVPAHTPGPPLHHHDFDEAFYILAGEAIFRLGDERVTRGPGELVWAPRGAHHCFANQSDADVRWLLICTPAGFERMFQRMAAKEAGVDPPPEALEPWPDVTVVGPRIGEEG